MTENSTPAVPALGYETTDLLPTEITAVKELQVKWLRVLNQRAQRGITLEGLFDWARDVKGEYSEKLGLVVFVDESNVELDQYGKPMLSPIVMVTGRVADQDTDFSRAQFETQHGLLDGVEGKIGEDGLWREPDQQL